MKVAALDLGTNTFLCLIAEGHEGRLTHVHSDLAEVVRLGQDVSRTRKFHPEALARARGCLERFRAEIDLHKVDLIAGVATAAAREVENGNELFALAQELGLPLKTISGEEEARLSYLGAQAGLSAEITRLVIDIGGGSTELIIGKGQKILFSKSLPMGGVKLTEKFISHQPVSEQEQRQLILEIQGLLDLVANELKSCPIDEIVAVAGTPTALASMELGGFDSQKVDGYKISTERLRELAIQLAGTSINDKQKKWNLGGRADIIYAGTSILLAVTQLTGRDGVTVSTKGLRYGVAMDSFRCI